MAEDSNSTTYYQFKSNMKGPCLRIKKTKQLKCSKILAWTNLTKLQEKQNGRRVEFKRQQYYNGCQHHQAQKASRLSK